MCQATLLSLHQQHVAFLTFSTPIVFRCLWVTWVKTHCDKANGICHWVKGRQGFSGFVCQHLHVKNQDTAVGANPAGEDGLWLAAVPGTWVLLQTQYLKQVSRINLMNLSNEPVFRSKVHCSYRIWLCCISFFLTSSWHLTTFQIRKGIVIVSSRGNKWKQAFRLSCFVLLCFTVCWFVLQNMIWSYIVPVFPAYYSSFCAVQTRTVQKDRLFHWWSPPWMLVQQVGVSS